MNLAQACAALVLLVAATSMAATTSDRPVMTPGHTEMPFVDYVAPAAPSLPEVRLRLTKMLTEGPSTKSSRTWVCSGWKPSLIGGEYRDCAWR